MLRCAAVLIANEATDAQEAAQIAENLLVLAKGLEETIMQFKLIR